jgi:hypothetical protein
VAAILFASLTWAQSSTDHLHAAPSSRRENAVKSSEAPAQNTFTGVIAKSGDKLVLTDPLTKTSYQLDDQRRAHELVNKSVKVTGTLNPATGTIHVTAIDAM